MAKRTKTSSAISAINRRAKLIYNLYGEGSEEYQLFTAKMVSYDIRINADGVVQIRDTKANRRNYRKLNAWARQIKKRPAAVEKRNAARRDKQYRDFVDDMETDTGETGGVLDRATYEKWLSTFSDYFASCYDLATREGYEGNDALERADVLYWNEEEYNNVWNNFYSAGAFADFMNAEKEYHNAAWYQKYTLDPETGTPVRNPDFMDDFNSDRPKLSKVRYK